MINELLEKIPDEFYIEDLVYHVSETLTKLEVYQSSKRVSNLPTDRTIRYYITKELVDRPLLYHKKKAIFTKRHYLQVILIKILEARGFPLKVIKEFLKRDDAQLKDMIEETPPTIETLDFAPLYKKAPHPAPLFSAQYEERKLDRWYRLKIEDGIEILWRDGIKIEENKVKFLLKKFEKIIKFFGGE